MFDLSYQEKSVWGTLAAMVVVYGYYFSAALHDVGRPEFGTGSLGRLIFAVIALIVIQVVYHIALALESRPEPKDERDTLIESKAYRTAYFFLTTGISLLAAAIIVINTFALHSREAWGTVTPFAIVNLILLAMVLAESAKLLTQLFYYRRGLR
ncbi:MAG: hypothetical protein P4M04_10100 [Acidobacteriota bacterium]|nr:hypothetical protein [Acidobacteriota bacterium]